MDRYTTTYFENVSELGKIVFEVGPYIQQSKDANLRFIVALLRFDDRLSSQYHLLHIVQKLSEIRNCGDLNFPLGKGLTSIVPSISPENASSKCWGSRISLANERSPFRRAKQSCSRNRYEWLPFLYYKRRRRRSNVTCWFYFKPHSTSLMDSSTYLCPSSLIIFSSMSLRIQLSMNLLRFSVYSLK